MDQNDLALMSDDRIVAQFLLQYHRIWQRHFGDLIKRAHWHAIFAARCNPVDGASCRSLHRVLYGAYGTDIRTCIERIKECEAEGFLRIVDAARQPCAVTATCQILPTQKLRDSFDRHCRETIAGVWRVFGEPASGGDAAIACGDDAVSAIFDFFGAYDRKWREAGDVVVRKKGLTIAHVEDAMNHLVTYQYWAIVMLLWATGASGGTENGSAVLVVDEIISKMWDALKLGHLAIKERVGNLLRWGFFAEHTVKKRKAVSLTPVAAEAMGKSLAQSMPALRELHRKLAPADVETRAVQPV
ncbi:MAG: hypothetical protein JO267_13210 [Alphaproteobacteria bacterium]|nr:hypothetical protein [Alphaproteobacteria bacterium]